jgi:Fur family ferric uptake transcriptional regulator
MKSSSVDAAILDVLNAHAPGHLTAAQVYEQIQPRLPAVNPSTVYRALERLAKKGRISVSDMGSGAAVYEAFSDPPHHHLVCQQCGRIEMLSHQQVQGLFSGIADQYGYTIVTNHLILFGICPACQKLDEGTKP